MIELEFRVLKIVGISLIFGSVSTGLFVKLDSFSVTVGKGATVELLSSISVGTISLVMLPVMLPVMLARLRFVCPTKSRKGSFNLSFDDLSGI